MPSPAITKRGAQMKYCLAVVMLVVAASWFYFATRPSAPKPELRPHEGVGEALAEETVKLLTPGKAVVLITWDTSVFPNPAVEMQTASFQRALQQRKISLAATNRVRLDPLRLPRVPPGDFLELIRRRADGDVIVSLLGPPFFSAEQRARLGSRKVKVVALCSGDMPRREDLKSLFDSGLLHTAIISRRAPEPRPPSGELPRAWFEHFYQIVTVTNQAALTPTDPVRKDS